MDGSRLAIQVDAQVDLQECEIGRNLQCHRALACRRFRTPRGSKCARVSDIIAYTDGGCRENPGGLGGWAFVLVDRKTRQTLERADAVRETTSNRMELTAVIEALSALKARRARVLVLSDSSYVVNCGERWIEGWKRLGWKRREGPLKNVDLLERLDGLREQHVVEWRWVRGHAGEHGNERADELVNSAMDRLIAGLRTRWERRDAWAHALPHAAKQREDF